MITDERLRELFRQESADYLQRLDDGLLQLERNPANDDPVEELFRVAHSLKGAAHMLGLQSVELVAHSLEDMLDGARRDVDARSAEHVHEMLRQLADIRGSITAALTTTGVPGDNAEAEERSRPVGSPSPQTALAPFGLDAVRVEARRLDALFHSVGELTVARTRVSRRVADLDAVVNSCEEFRRDVAKGLALGSHGSLALLERLAPVEAMLSRLRAALDDDCARLEFVSGELNDGIRAIRLLPLGNIFRQFPRMVQELTRLQGKAVDLVIEGEDVGVDKRILEEIRDPLMHLLRNAIDHGIEPAAERSRAGKPAAGRIGLRARRSESAVEITVHDDGRGLDDDAIRQAAQCKSIESAAALAAMTSAQLRSLILRPGLTTALRVSDVSGRGIGLDVVRASVERMKGELTLESTPGRGLNVTLRLPATLVTARILIVEVDRCSYGLPVEHVRGMRRVEADALLQLEGRDAILFDGAPVPLASLGDLLDRPSRARKSASERPPQAAVILATVDGCAAVLVDALADEQDVVLQPLGGLLERVRNVAGAAILDSGKICPVLRAPDLIASTRHRAGVGAAAGAADSAHALERKKRVLLAEDSITTRTQESRILVAAGYDVVTAVDGLDAWQKLARTEFDALVTDVNMPNLDGFGLARRIRADARLAGLPVILVTSLASDEDRMQGLDAGANAYIPKPSFDQSELIECLARLI